MNDQNKKIEVPLKSQTILDTIRQRRADAEPVVTHGQMRNLNADYDRVIDGKDEEFDVLNASTDSRFDERMARAAQRVTPMDVEKVFPKPAPIETKTGPQHRAEPRTPMQGILGIVKLNRKQ